MEWRSGCRTGKKIWPRVWQLYKVSGSDPDGWWKGQVNIALEVLDELKLAIPVCGMVKDDHHRTRGLYFNNEEIPIDRHSEGFPADHRIQDEAHRFAIEYHRSLRSKQQVHSVLDDIPNIGQTRRKALMRQFQSLEKIREATVEQLQGSRRDE